MNFNYPWLIVPASLLVLAVVMWFAERRRLRLYKASRHGHGTMNTASVARVVTGMGLHAMKHRMIEVAKANGHNGGRAKSQARALIAESSNVAKGAMDAYFKEVRHG